MPFWKLFEDGINIIEEERIYIAKTRKELDKEAHRILEKGMRGENPDSIATALQVFYNLDCLGASVNNVFNEVCINAEVIHRGRKNILKWGASSTCRRLYTSPCGIRRK